MKPNIKKVALVTGASGGIGSSIVKRLASKGIVVVINYRTRVREASRLEAKLTSEGHQVIKIIADVSNARQVNSMVASIIATYGQIDILVNCAGYNIDKPLIKMKESDWDKVVDINLKGVFLTSRAVAPYLLKSYHGKIINIASETAYSGRKNGANFCAAKAGVIALTKCIALELAPHVQANTIIPGLIETQETVSRLHLDRKQVRKNRIQRIPAYRIGTPEDIAGLVDFLIGDDAKYITGQSIFVNGGSLMWT